MSSTTTWLRVRRLSRVDFPASSVHLELHLARAAAADAAGEAAHRLAVTREPRQAVAELRELDLEASLSSGRVLGEDVEDELRAVDDALLHQVSDVAHLCGREVLVEDHQARSPLPGAHDQIPKLSLTDQVARIGLRALLAHRVDDRDSGRARELPHLREAFVRVRISTEGDRDEHGTIPASAGVDAALALCQAILELLDPFEEVELELAGGQWLVALDGQGPVLSRAERCVLGEPREPRGVDLNRNHRVQPKQHQVGEVVLGERLAAQVRDDAAQTPEASGAAAHALEVG
jgi:hypothetical protein